MSSYNLYRDPWGEAAISGLVALVPVRKYPRWLRRALVLGPVLVSAAGMSYVVTHPGNSKRFAQRISGTKAEPPESVVQDNEAASEVGSINGGALAMKGAAMGAVLGGGIGAGTWLGLRADEWIEGQLRRLRVPYPRIVMGLGAAAVAWWIVDRDNKNETLSIESDHGRPERD